MIVMDNCCQCNKPFRFKRAQLVKYWGGIWAYDPATFIAGETSPGALLGRGRLPQMTRYLKETIRTEGPDGVDVSQWKQQTLFYGKDGPTAAAVPARTQFSDSINGIYYDQGYDDDGTFHDIDLRSDPGFVNWDFLWDLITHFPENVTRTISSASETGSSARWDDAGLSGHPADYIIYTQTLDTAYAQTEFLNDIQSYQDTAYDLADESKIYNIDGTPQIIQWATSIAERKTVFAWRKWPHDPAEPFNFASGPPDFDDQNILSESDPLSNFDASVNYYPVVVRAGPPFVQMISYGLRSLVHGHTHGATTGAHSVCDLLVETGRFACKTRDCYAEWDDSGTNDDLTLADDSCVPQFFISGKFIIKGFSDTVQEINKTGDPPAPGPTCPSKFYTATIINPDQPQLDCCLPPP